MTGPAYAAIHDAMAQLAGVCDFAESQDGQGFNATDTWLGHVLAAMPVTGWTDDEALAAWDMLRKYRGQLGGFGVSYEDLPLLAGAEELEAARRDEARERARQRGRQWRDQQYRKANSYVRCDGAGEKVTLAFPFDPAMVDQAKAIKGRYFDWDTKTNVFPFTSLPQIVAFADEHGIDVAPEVRALNAAAASQAAQEAARPDVCTDQAGRVVISAEYNPKLNETLKALNGGRSTWDRTARLHRPLVHRDPGQVLAIAEEFGLTVSDDARAEIEGEAARQDRNTATATAVEADPVLVPGLAPGAALKPQQYPVVRFALDHRRVLIGDDMGWGKTLSSLAAVAADGAYPAVVVCRPNLTLNWVAEIRRFFPSLAVHQASGATPQPIPDGTSVIVIGSAALAAKPVTTKKGSKEFGWVTALAAAAPKALIIDEGQDTKERGANRSQACEQLAAAVIGRDGLVLDLTGTAILNRPRELCQQLTILGRIGEFGGPKAFLWRYCLSDTSEWGASYNSAQNLIELHQRLLAWGIMIRRADDAALGLPPCREHVLCIPEADLDPVVMARYRQAEQDLLGFLAERARQVAERLGADPAHAAVQAAMRAQAAEHLVAINTLRQLAGQAKRPAVMAWTHERVQAGEKVMVAAHHRGEVDAYAAEFGGLKLQGGQPVAEKEAVKAAFQQQPAAQAPVIAVAIGAGGVGHTLTAARIGIQAEQAWTPGETQQMKKRLHRIGQDQPVDYYITVAERTIDEDLWDIVTAKQATLNAVLDGRSDTRAADDEGSVAAELTWRLTQQGLGTEPDPGPGHELAGAPVEVAAQQARQVPDLSISDPPGPDVPARAVNTQWTATCARCHDSPPGSGGILCPSCRAEIEIRNASLHSRTAAPDTGHADEDTPGGNPDESPPARSSGRAVPVSAPADSDDGDEPAAAVPARHADRLRRSAHQYLDHGLQPVPAWAAKASGECCCPRGGDCPRPGKHPRSVHVGPEAYDYSWKPLTCATHEEVDQRFADDGEYADANLMLAIPAGMLVIDQDNEDGGQQAIAALGEQLGELPATLSHRTPHGEHHIYRTPPGWTGRAWVGKDASNPLPAGIDLRVPGQILMAPPSRVPAHGGPAPYGPPSGTSVADLPAAYVTAWTPPQSQPGVQRRPVPVPAAQAGAAAAYVHAKIEGIVADLASHEPGGRNTAIYTAALKAGSALGATRATDGAEHAAGGWTEEAAEEALLAAAEQNGYTSDHSTAAARSAIRSGLRNGLRNPRPLPDFTASTRRPDQQREPSRRQPQPGREEPAARQAPPAPRPAAAEAGRTPGHPAPPRAASRRAEPTPRSVSAVLGSAGYLASSRDPHASYGPEGYRVQAQPDGGILITHVALGEDIAGARPGDRADQMLARYTRTLQDAGFHVTRRTPGSLAVTPQPPGTPASGPAAPGNQAHDGIRMQANRIAVAANEAYRAGDLDQARQLVDQAAELDPSRAGLWQQQRTEIAAKRLFTRARAARAEGDQRRADKLIGDARQLDPRMQMLWDRQLTGVRSSQVPRQPAGTAGRGAGRASGAGREASPQRPRRPVPGPAPETNGPGTAHADPRIPAPGLDEAAAAREPASSGSRPRGAAARPPEVADWRDHVIETGRQAWQPRVVQPYPPGPGPSQPSGPEATGPEISGPEISG